MCPKSHVTLRIATYGACRLFNRPCRQHCKCIVSCVRHVCGYQQKSRERLSITNPCQLDAMCFAPEIFGGKQWDQLTLYNAPSPGAPPSPRHPDHEQRTRPPRVTAHLLPWETLGKVSGTHGEHYIFHDPTPTSALPKEDESRGPSPDTYLISPCSPCGWGVSPTAGSVADLNISLRRRPPQGK